MHITVKPLRLFRRFAPKSLLWRSLLIVLLPIVILQAISLQFFYGNHLDVVSQRFSQAVVGEMSFVLALYKRYPNPADRAWINRTANERFGIKIIYEPHKKLTSLQSRPPVLFGPMDQDLARDLQGELRLPFTANWQKSSKAVFLSIELPEGLMIARIPRKHLYTDGLYLFVLWIAGSTVVLSFLATLFTRNQVRSIRRLAEAAERFVAGQEASPIRVSGAAEVRRAGQAFNTMQERVQKYLSQRRDMLAGVSHDLRTPLTRIKLTLAMMKRTEESRKDFAEIETDVQEMERMIGGYLNFVRGEGSEQPIAINPEEVLRSLIARMNGTGSSAEFVGFVSDEGQGKNQKNKENYQITVRPDAFQRALENLLQNAARYGEKVKVSLKYEPVRHRFFIFIDDNGPGIPPDKAEDLFRPFIKGPGDGTGLGLTIARDIVRAHGGDITLLPGPEGGTRAQISLPEELLVQEAPPSG